ncbi:DMT family transporter [Chitinivorax sp. B]|uniref:DMT family transporter n=1 Tax=Chitinivorax sp. B TaxID=2502235 RepID=UPI0010F6C8FA|nr:DMT family transporter [Chitinivorax sp. B]
MSPKSPNGLALAAIVLWASLATLSVKLTNVPPFLLVGLSLMIGSLGSVHRIREWRVPLRTLLIGCVGLFGYHFCLFLALRWSPALSANLLNYLWPLLLVLLSPMLLPGYQIGVNHILGGILGFAGAALLIVGGDGLQIRADHAWGYLLAIAAAVIWAVYSLLTKRLPAFPTSAVGGFCAISGMLALLCHLLLEPSYQPVLAEWIQIAMLGIGPLGAAFFLWDAALKRGDPRMIGTLAYLTPLLSTASLVLLGGSELTPMSLVSLGLILGGAWLGSRPARQSALV